MALQKPTREHEYTEYTRGHLRRRDIACILSVAHDAGPVGGGSREGIKVMRCRGIGAFLIAAAVMASATTLLPAHGTAQTLRDRLRFGRPHRIAKMLLTVVNISTHKMSTDVTDAADKGEPRRVEAFGSGFIIDPSGLIVTNRHVVEGAFDVTVILPDGTALPAKLRGAGRTIDIALLEVTPPKPLPTVTWGDSDKVRVGDQVLAVGNPLGVGESVSAKSSAPRTATSWTRRSTLHRDRRGDQPWQFWRTVVQPARRGDRGEHRDLLADRASGSIGIGFAIPSIDARAAADQLRRTGELQQGWLGLRAQDVTPNIADAFDLPVPYGTVVVGVETDGPAARAGLQAGDVVLKFGKQVPKDARALARMIAATEIGQPALLLVWRDHKEQTITATVAGWPDEQPSSGDPVPKRHRRYMSTCPILACRPPQSRPRRGPNTSLPKRRRAS